MANQPPARPWLRLPTMGRQPAAPAPAPAPAPQPQQPQPPARQQPRIPIIRPAFRPAFAQPQSAPPPPPSAPPTQPPSPASPPPPYPITSPSPPPSRPSPPPVVASPPTPTPTASPKIVEPESPIKATRSPPPISLPPPQLEPMSLPEAEQEKVLLQDTFNKKVVFPTSDREGNSFNGFSNSTKHGRHKDARKKAASDSEDGKSVRIISMTGDNKGALMELDFPSRRNNARNDSGKSDGGNAERSKNNDRDRMAAQSRVPMSGYVNSNVQGINNSILYSCSFTHHDPGVHFSLSRKPLHRKGKDEGNGHGIHHPNGKQL